MHRTKFSILLTWGTSFDNTLPNKDEEAFENIMGLGENAGNQHFLHFPQYFLPNQRQKSPFVLHLFCYLQMLSIWFRPKFCSEVKS